MAIVVFTATRNLASGFALNDVVTIFFKVTKAARQPMTVADREVSYAGIVRQNILRFDNFVDIDTQMFTGLNRDIFEMFLESIRSGEAFSGNFRGDDINSLSQYMIEGNYTPTDLNLKMTRYSFKVRAL